MNRAAVRQILDSHGVQYAVIGAIAVAARGAPRSTFDFDLFTVDEHVLQASLWTDLRASGVQVAIRKGDFDDPLAGVVRIGAGPDQIDLVVGKWKWQHHVIERAEWLEIEGVLMRVPTTSDLVLLKLDAGGPIDQQDVIRLLTFGPREQLIVEVNDKIRDLPEEAIALWQKIVASSI